MCNECQLRYGLAPFICKVYHEVYNKRRRNDIYGIRDITLHSRFIYCTRYIGELVRSSKIAWWRHQMETFSALLAICAGNSPVPGEFPAQRPVTRSFDVFFDLRPNKRLSKHWSGWWFGTPSRPLWCHCNAILRPEQNGRHVATYLIIELW